MSLVRLLLRCSRGAVVLTVLAGIVSGVSSVGLLALIHVALSDEPVSLALVAGGFVGLCVVTLLTRILSQTLLIRLGQGAVYQLCMHLSRRILAVPLRRLEEVGTPRLLAVLTDDVQVVSSAFLGIPVLCINVAVLGCCLLYLAWLSLPLCLAVLGFLAVGVLSYELPVIGALRQLRLAREEQDALMKHFRGLTEGVKELKLHRERRTAFLTRVLGTTAQALRGHNTAGLSLFVAAGSWGQLLSLAAIGLLLFAVPVLGSVDRATQSGFVLAILYTISPLEIIMSWLPALGRARVALGKIEALGLLLAERADDEGTPAPARPVPAWQSLELAGVQHRYRAEGDEGGFTLGPLDLRLQPGELVFLVGGNGSGKTTLAKLLTGLYAPEMGEILWDGQLVTGATREHYRQLFTAVFADFYLFDELLGIDTGRLDVRARDLLGSMDLARVVQVEAGRLSTTDLSRGQRKRLALLTACLEDRPVYVFDEWAADQDPRFKEVFYTRVLPELRARGKCVLVISHDDHYFDVADRLLKLDYGQLTELTPEPVTAMPV